MNNIDTIKHYHQQTKHRLDKYASGPETIDWEAQPSPFRYYEGTDIHRLALAANTLNCNYDELWQSGVVKRQPLTIDSLGIFFELALGLSAWKVYGTAKWSLRCNPSSGNLHPTEAYAVLPAVADLQAGIYHYCPKEHALETRGLFQADEGPKSNHRFYIALSSIAWREAWKYGERAFRYCQLDTGHAVMTIRLAAAALGWQAQVFPMAPTELATFLGLDRADDFVSDETEHAELMIAVECDAGDLPAEMKLLDADFFGKANQLDRQHFYQWPIIETAFEATTANLSLDKIVDTARPPRTMRSPHDASASSLIQGRRSAIDFNPRAQMSLTDFFQIADALLPRPGASPWDIYPFEVNISLVFYIHRVEGLRPGLYALMRNEKHLPLFQHCMRKEFQWDQIDSAPTELPLFRLLNANAQNAAGTLSCQQAIAANSAFCLSMISDYAQALTKGAGMYRHLHWEAGLIGQILYLEAENITFRGTGIGCFFDDAVHETLGIKDDSLQVVYHFTVGEPVVDHRITTIPPYADRQSE